MVWNDTADALAHPDYGTLGPVPLRRPGGHTGGNGIALISGGDVTPGTRAARSAFDVAPTILDLLGAAPAAAGSGTSFISLL